MLSTNLSPLEIAAMARADRLISSREFPDASRMARDALDDFSTGIIKAEAFSEALDRAEESITDPLRYGLWISLSPGVQVFRWQGMGYGRVEDTRLTEDRSKHVIDTHRCSDGTLHEGIRAAKKHELKSYTEPGLIRDGFLPRPTEAVAA